MSHKKYYICSICSAKCVIEYEDGESYRQYITCPNHRYEAKRIAESAEKVVQTKPPESSRLLGVQPM